MVSKPYMTLIPREKIVKEFYSQKDDEYHNCAEKVPNLTCMNKKYATFDIIKYTKQLLLQRCQTNLQAQNMVPVG